MSPEEKQELAHYRRSLKQRFAMACLLVALAFPSIYMAFKMAHHSNLGLAAGLSFFFFTIVGSPFIALYAKNTLLRIKTLGRDLALGRICIFEGTIGNSEQLMRELNKISKKGSLIFEAGRRQSFQVLLISGTVLAANGTKAKNFSTSEVLEATAPPKDQLIVQAGDTGDLVLLDHRFELLQRHLSQHERRELKWHIHQLKKPPQFLIFAFFWIVVCIGSYLVDFFDGNARDWLRSHMIHLGILAGYITISARYYYRSYIRAQLMERDLDRGTLKVLRLASSEQEKLKLTHNTDSEILPISGTIWASAGKPGAWRLIHSWVRLKI
jgi:hypothetical protein